VNWTLLILAGVLYGVGVIILRAGSRRGTTTWGLALYFGLTPCIVGMALGWSWVVRVGLGYGWAPLAMGLMVVAAIWASAEALRRGPTGPFFLVQNFSLVIPVAASILFYGESLGLWRAAGLGLTVVALVLIRGADGKRRPAVADPSGGRGWFFYTMISVLLFGAVQVIMRDGAARYEHDNAALAGFVVLSYLGEVLGACVGLAVSRHRPTRADAAWGTAHGVVTAAGFAMSMFALKALGGVLLFPARFMASAAVVILLAVIIFKERPNARTAVGIALGIAAVVLLGIKASG